MARMSSLRLWRFRVAAWVPPPLRIGIFLVLDVLEMAASVALARVSPPPVALVHAPYPVVDVPVVMAPFSASVAALGLAAGILMGASLIYELVVMYRRSRYAFAYTRRRRRGPITTSRAATP
jgi:hypothetical protein